MAKRSLIVFALTLVLVTSAVPIRHVHGILMTPDEVAMLDATSRDDDGQSKGDNTFVRVLKAPVKAIIQSIAFPLSALQAYHKI